MLLFKYHNLLEKFNKFIPSKNSTNVIKQLTDINIDIQNYQIGIFHVDNKQKQLLNKVFNELGINNIDISFNSNIKYDLIISGNNFKWLKQLRNNGYNQFTSVIMISDNFSHHTKITGYKSGVDYFIEKPYNQEIIKFHLAQILKKQLQVKKNNKQKENFVAALTHDLKSPINAQIKILELILNNNFGIISKDQQEIINNLLNSSKYMKFLADKILSHYKMNNSNILLNKDEVYFEDIVEDSVSCMKFLTEEKKQKVYIHKKNIHKKISIDVIEIKRVINNLISNAVEYSPSYSDINIVITDNIKDIIFKITDKGCGISNENISNIFNEYMSLAKTQKTIGFGLGLNICKKIINAHNGTIGIESTPGKGTTISFTLPK